MSSIIRPVKGTRDFYPDLMRKRTWLYDHMRRAAEAYGYQEWEAPIIETLELYAAKSGEELVKEQSFVFEDRGGNEVTLRPELTPSLARMIAQKSRELPKPIRWWSFGPFWRYERPQKGRTREFFQWNVDCLGTSSIVADAEIAAIAVQMLRNIGFTSDKLVVYVNSRQLMDRKIAELGVSDKDGKAAVLRMIDKIDKMSREKWHVYGEGLGLSSAQIEGLEALLGNKDLWQEAPELVEFFGVLENLGVRDWFEYNANIVRGLNYYTGVVMEGRDRAGDHRAIFGGGRYDNLVADVGGDAVTGVGFAMGDVVISLIAEEYGLVPQMASSSAQVLVTVFDAEHMPASLKLAKELRAGGLTVEIYPEAVKLAKQFKYGDKVGIPIGVVVGPDDLAAGTVAVKRFADRKQMNVAQTDAVDAIFELLNTNA